MPPPFKVAVLADTVEELIVSVEKSELTMPPPPKSPLVVLPDTVEELMVSVPP